MSWHQSESVGLEQNRIHRMLVYNLIKGNNGDIGSMTRLSPELLTCITHSVTVR